MISGKGDKFINDFVPKYDGDRIDVSMFFDSTASLRDAMSIHFRYGVASTVITYTEGGEKFEITIVDYRVTRAADVHDYFIVG